MISYTYAQAINQGFPNVVFSSPGDGSVYDNILWISGDALPSQAQLDAWITTAITNEMWELIKAERDRRTSTGGYKVGTDWFHSDTTSRIQQIGLVMMGAGIPANTYWKTMSGSFVVMTQTLAGQIFTAAATSDLTIFSVAEQKKAAMLASADPANYDYLTGWPLIYGE
jgi:hypothetical protein